MSTAIIKYRHTDEMKFYCKTESYPAGLGFLLLDLSKQKEPHYLNWLMHQPDRIIQVSEVPKDIEYEYVIDIDNNAISCQECWWTDDKNYHGGGFRHGGVYDLNEWQEKTKLEEKYSYRLPQYWS